jgi:hypothetical protein
MLILNLKTINCSALQHASLHAWLCGDTQCWNYLHATTVAKRKIADFIKGLPVGAQLSQGDTESLREVWETDDPAKLIRVWNSFDLRAIRFELSTSNIGPIPDYEPVPFPIVEGPL